MESLANSGDPRSRPHLRTAAERAELSEEARVAAIGGLSGEYSTAKDGEFLRALYGRVSSERLRDAVMSGVAQIGGNESRNWMLAIARNADEPVRSRRHAIELADRIGIPVAELARLYDTIEDSEVRSVIISELSQLGTRAASEKLIAIARNDPVLTNRRRAIQALGRFDDERVRDALRDLVKE